MAAAPRATVVVPTRDRPDALRRCLAALGRQTLEDLEIVVVDDGSQDPTPVRAAVDATPRARLLHGRGEGPARARNLGASVARGDVVCFTDDDCVPDAGWAAGLLAAVDAGAGAAAGPTRAPTDAGPVVEAAQLVASHLSEHGRDHTTGSMVFAPTSNLACRADVHDALPFDEAYPLAAGEDRDWCARLRAAGHRLVFVPDARVLHRQELDLRGFWRQQVRYGRGGWRYHRTGAGLEAPGHYIDLLVTAFRTGVRVGVLVCLAQLATAVGMVRQALTDRRRPVRG